MTSEDYTETGRPIEWLLKGDDEASGFIDRSRVTADGGFYFA